MTRMNDSPLAIGDLTSWDPPGQYLQNLFVPRARADRAARRAALIADSGHAGPRAVESLLALGSLLVIDGFVRWMQGAEPGGRAGGG